MNYYLKKFLDELELLNIKDRCIVTEGKYVEVCVGGTNFRFWPDIGVCTIDRSGEALVHNSDKVGLERLKARVVLRELGD